MTQDQPLPVVLALVRNDAGELLVVRRAEGGDFEGLWGLPGGKVEVDEFLAEAIEREVREETGVETRFVEHRGLVSEHVVEDGELAKHVPIHVCLLDVVDASGHGTEESAWLAPDEVPTEETVPSLLPIVDTFLDEPATRYVESVLVREGGDVRLERFG